jgi:hypothetical protein
MGNRDYPYVRCGPDDDEWQLGYVICQHVAAHELPVGLVVAATTEDFGQVLCEPCGRDDDLMIDADTIKRGDFVIMCALCVGRAGYLQ